MADAMQHLIRDIRECDLNSDIDIYEICRKEAIEMSREAVDALKERLSLVEDLKIQKELLVITGIGKHSKGKAILPNTIRNFLIQNRIQLAR
ncbi:hypothetical protein ZOSMA_422G00040 [Zostera marina]|uniref:Smr domain-containing protein n=1 Tax=Zostera marina TaxID=29655 RepID=A0A0K9P4L8_ZOSMR|nr:hypothetical protein ZOSMA_422G00040 [Zostera marina]